MTDKTLIVAATGFEVEPTLDALGIREPRAQGLGVSGLCLESERVDCLITGVGQLQCAARLMSRLCEREYSRVIQAGIAGSFSEIYPKLAVVNVTEEVLGDFGAEGDGSFLDIGDMGLLPRESAPFTEGVLRVERPVDLRGLKLPEVRSVTVNRTLSDPRSIGWVTGRYSPDVVNMEGAAFFYVCLTKGVPFVELRAISDMVGPRDKSSWDIKGAIQALNMALLELV
jgi:futalosine hydrolase